LKDSFSREGIDLDLMKRLWELPSSELKSILKTELRLSGNKHNNYTRLLKDLIEEKISEEQ
jgi:hypothetical protein